MRFETGNRCAVGPKLRQRPRNVAAKTNSDVEFVCDVYSNPPPSVYWLKNGVNVTLTDYVQTIHSRTLSIMGVLPSDAGMFQCMAVAADIGSLQSAAQLIVHESGTYAFSLVFDACSSLFFVGCVVFLLVDSRYFFRERKLNLFGNVFDRGIMPHNTLLYPFYINFCCLRIYSVYKDCMIL